MTVFEEAILFAVKAHEGQTRKGNSIPYIIHPLEVASICAAMSDDLELMAAAVLHDTVEDTDTTLEEIEAKFGHRVAELVASETENKRPELPAAETWRVRKEESLEELSRAKDPAVKMLWLADKLANMRSFYSAWKDKGHNLWQDFNQKDPAQQAWYYRNIIAKLEEFKGLSAWNELDHYIKKIFEGVK